MRILLGLSLARARALESSQERLGRMRLHLIAAVRAGHWGWHLAGIAREMECIGPQTGPGFGNRQRLASTQQ